ncbi:MAG TPA: ribonuclease E inhibitor RraB [Gemmatimonadales bacterium]|nr:ribonuclease E inhibitor RraB [Gemmatimonadales bacterium]
MSLTVLIVLGFLGVYLMLRGGQREGITRHPAPDADASTIEQLAQAGSDLTRPHTIEFFLYLPEHAAAEAVASELAGEGYTTELSQEEQATDWLCLATRVMVPDMAALRACRERLTALAESHQGVYDGWGTEVEDG